MADEPARQRRQPVAAGGGAASEVSTWRWTGWPRRGDDESMEGSAGPAVRPTRWTATRLTMRHVALRESAATPLPDVLLALDAQYAEILGLLDRPAAVQRMVANVPAI